MAMKYRKKPVVVEAIQWTGKNLQELKNFVGDSLEYDVMDAAWEVGKGPVIVNVRIQTLEGIHHASVGDFIIKGIRGEFYPCKPDIFAKTYESASLTPPNEPLALEQLREMDGEPVYLIVDDGYEPLEMWALIDVPEKDHIVLINNIGGRSAYYSDDDLERDHITVYRRPPEGEEDT